PLPPLPRRDHFPYTTLCRSQASLIPTSPGTYTFHFVGSIKGQKVDQTFTSSEKTFDSPRAPSEVEFPAKNPATADLAARLERLRDRKSTRLNSSHEWISYAV